METRKIQDAKNRIRYLSEILQQERNLTNTYALGFLQTISQGLDEPEISRAVRVAGSVQEMRSRLL